VSRDVTTPLSGTVSHPLAGTIYDQPVHHIWSLYVNSLWRYERRQKLQKLGVVLLTWLIFVCTTVDLEKNFATACC